MALSKFSQFTARLLKNRLALIALLILAMLLTMAVCAPWLAPHDPYTMRGESMLAPPGPAHWLGGDQLGRDVLSRLLHGARISFTVGISAVSIALVAGTLLGTLAGYFGGWLDMILSRIVDILFSIPDILFALAIMAVIGPTTGNVMVAIGIVYTPIFARIARASALELRHALYVEAARSMGAGHGSILLRHILPGMASPLIVQITLSLAFAMLAEAALSFLGLGVEPDTPSWGIMLNQGKDLMEQAWWVAVFPGIAITLAVFSFNALGDGLRDALDPKVARHE